MKKLIPFIIVLLAFVSCEEETTPAVSALGKWREMEFGNVEYTFYLDKTYECVGVVYDEETNALLGYWSRSVGSYTIDEKITLYPSKVYIKQDYTKPYVRMDELVPASLHRPAEFGYYFDSDEELLTLTPICGPNENCTGPEVFERVIESEDSGL